MIGGALGVVQGVQAPERALLHRAQVLLAADLLLGPQALLGALQGSSLDDLPVPQGTLLTAVVPCVAVQAWPL